MEKAKVDYVIRQYKPGDEDKIVKLLLDTFQPWPKFDIACSAVDHWRWKFIDSPTNKNMYTHTVADLHGEIIGVDHGMLYRIKIGEGTYGGEKGADTAVNPNYRGQGIYSKMSKLKHEIVNAMGYEFDYALSNNPIFVKSTQKKRLEKDPEAEAPFPHLPKSLTRINDVSMHFKHAVKEDTLEKTRLQTGVYGSKIINKISNPWSKTTLLGDVSINEITVFDDRINTFYEKIKPNYYFLVEKTKDYMNWRYCDKRGGNFNVWTAEENDEIVGYLVLKINKRNVDYPEGYIVDLLAFNERENVADNLAKFAFNYFDEREVNVIWAEVVGGHPYERILGKYGMLDTMMKPNLTWKTIKPREDYDQFANAPPGKLHYTFGEGDAI